MGKVTCCNDPEGSHGFCVFNNVAIGAAYAKCVYRPQSGPVQEHSIDTEIHSSKEQEPSTEKSPPTEPRVEVQRVAIIDFDVHHGNGTEEIVRYLTPRVSSIPFSTAYGSGTCNVNQYKPWLDENDAEEVFFASVHGYGRKDPVGEYESSYQQSWFYPGSGCTTATDQDTPPATDPASATDPTIDPTTCSATDPSSDTDPATSSSGNIYNVGLGFVQGMESRRRWRRAFRENILRKLVLFNPDLILLSSGFDGHKKEIVNWGYLQLLESDYEWVTTQLVQVANKCCQGRLVSVLEGGYNFHGRIVSSFARSVAAHVRALSTGSRQEYNLKDAQWEAQFEQKVKEDAIKKKMMKRVEGMQNRNIDRRDNEEEDGGGRSKRSKKEVDYVALALQLDAEEGSKVM